MRIIDSLLGKKSVPGLSVQPESAAAGQSQNRIESVSLVEADEAAGNAVLAERKRVAAINAVASPEQAEMRDKLIANGTAALEAVLALHEDAKTRPAAPAVTAEAVAKEMLRQLNSAALPAASTIAQEDKNVLEQYTEMKDQSASAEFYRQHKAEIDRLSNLKSKSKEGK